MAYVSHNVFRIGLSGSQLLWRSVPMPIYPMLPSPLSHVSIPLYLTSTITLGLWVILLETASGHLLDMIHQYKFCFPYPARGKELLANASNIPASSGMARRSHVKRVSSCTAARLVIWSVCFPLCVYQVNLIFSLDELNEDQPPQRAFLPSLFLTGRMEWWWRWCRRVRSLIMAILDTYWSIGYERASGEGSVSRVESQWLEV